MSRDYDPVPGKWYEDHETEEIFKVLSLDPDEELVRIQWLDREIEDLDLEENESRCPYCGTWNCADPKSVQQAMRELKGR